MTAAETRASPAYMTPRDIAERWQCSVRTVERKISDGTLRAVRFGPKLVRIRPEDLTAFEETLCALNDPQSTAGAPTPGTSSGPRADARVASLQRRQTRG